MRRRVVVTGLGAVTPIGHGSEGLYQGLRRERSAIDRITRFDATQFNCRIAGEVRDFDPAQYLDQKRMRRLDRYSQFAVACAHMAVADARREVFGPDQFADLAFSCMRPA